MKIAKTMTNKSQNQHLDSISRSSSKLPVTSQNPWNSAKFADSMNSQATLSSIPGRSADCI